MSRVPARLAAAALCLAAVPALAQPGPAAAPPAPAAAPPSLGAEAIPTGPRAPAPTPAPAPAPTPPPKPVIAEPVAATPLAAPDAFSTPARDTGLPPTLWRGTSLAVVKAVLPKLAEHPLSPAAAALARRVLATGAQGPDGAGDDPALLGARAEALMAQGDPKGAAAILARAPGVDRDPNLARAAAESALLAGDDARACAIEEGLAAGRAEIYWVRLRAYCEAVAGKASEAQLTFDLANGQARDAVYARLMAAKLAGGGKPGPASLRDGLDYALSRSLGLDVSQAKASPEVAAALGAADPSDPVFDPASFSPDVAPVAQAIASGQAARPGDFVVAVEPKPKAAAAKAALRMEDALVLLGAYERWPPSAEGLPAAREGRAPVLRDLALDAAATQKRIGETALLALWNCLDAGPTGLAPPDRARIVWALREVGLDADARAFALEGLAGLK